MMSRGIRGEAMSCAGPPLQRTDEWAEEGERSNSEDEGEDDHEDDQEDAKDGFDDRLVDKLAFQNGRPVLSACNRDIFK
jgi:hypothetical protein